MSETDWHQEDYETTTGGTIDDSPSVRTSVVALLALVGIAVVIGAVDLLLQGQTPSVAAAVASWDWVVGVVLVILAIVIIFSAIRVVFRGVGVNTERSRERRARRLGHFDEHQYRDPAIDIARARYARGEIDQDQLDQTLRQLGKSS